MRKIESPERETQMGKWLRPEEDATYQDAATTPAERIVVMLLRYTGLRVGEATALRCSDIDLNEQTLMVRKTKGKTAGRRTIPLVWKLTTRIGDRVAAEALEAMA